MSDLVPEMLLRFLSLILNKEVKHFVIIIRYFEDKAGTDPLVRPVKFLSKINRFSKWLHKTELEAPRAFQTSQADPSSNQTINSAKSSDLKRTTF